MSNIKQKFLIVLALVCIIIAISLLFNEYKQVNDTTIVYSKIADHFHEHQAVKPEDHSSVNLLPETIKGWISVSSTKIDYPIVIGTDNDFYQSHDYNGDPCVYGAIFIDCRNSSSMQDDYTVIYGHNSKHSLMFSDLKKFIKYHDLPVKLWDRHYEYDCTVKAVSILSEDNPIYSLCDFNTMKDNIKNNALYYDDFDKGIILLSTCYGNRGTNKRLVVAISKNI